MPLSAVVTTGIGPYWHSLMGLEVVTRSSTTTEIYWPEARSQGAEIVLYEIDVNGSFHASVPSHIQNRVIDGLVAGQTYLVEVWALDENGLWSRPLSAEFTEVAANAPRWPSGAAISVARTRHSVTLSWPSAIAGGGAIAYYELFHEGAWLAGVPSSVLELVVDGLHADEEYSFAIRALDEWNLTTPFLEVLVPGFAEFSVGAFDPSTGRWHLRSPGGGCPHLLLREPG